jgi:hypothetical protein
VTVTNCILRAGIVRVDGGDKTSVISISDSVIHNIGSTDQLVRYGQARFDNVEFVHVNNATERTISTRSFSTTGLSASYDTCRFR